MGWSGGATVGFSAAGRFYHQHKLSGSKHARSIACQNTPRSEWTNIIYQLSEYSYKKDCHNQIIYFYVGDSYLTFLDIGSTSDTTQHNLPNEADALSDPVPIPGGLALGITNQTVVYVSCIADSIGI